MTQQAIFRFVRPFFERSACGFVTHTVHHPSSTNLRATSVLEAAQSAMRPQYPSSLTTAKGVGLRLTPDGFGAVRTGPTSPFDKTEWLMPHYVVGNASISKSPRQVHSPIIGWMDYLSIHFQLCRTCSSSSIMSMPGTEPAITRQTRLSLNEVDPKTQSPTLLFLTRRNAASKLVGVCTPINKIF
ncbi:hypothetical protein FGO68_gene8766 [Halteria grandinella]|uniref:Uncharacterized protein n=1 Tax=Halteria grandinella TaxID=5974 RepID=A0A8J8SUW1_HALGN|nr:hypothetical protein FGO68_gene8766 [Halteria grandinella]